ncbi:hypothetical protein BSKO_02980 [Bryopsis sp. KO-2023]|nr:hypothetical protein BSKO_02980 [Bryopsis sp. KO-2023]
MLRGNPFNNVCVARRKRRRSFGGDHFRAALPPAKKVVEATCVTGPEEKRLEEETPLQIKVDLSVTRRTGNGTDIGEAVVLRLLSINENNGEIFIPMPIETARTDGIKRSCIDSEHPKSAQSIDKILEDVGLTGQIVDDSVENVEQTGVDKKADSSTQETVKEKPAISDANKEAEQKGVSFATVDSEATAHPDAGNDVKNILEKEDQSSNLASGGQETIEGTVEQQIMMLLTQHAHAPESRDPVERKTPSQPEKESGEDCVDRENSTQSTPQDQKESKSSNLELDNAGMGSSLAENQSHLDYKEENLMLEVHQTEESPEESFKSSISFAGGEAPDINVMEEEMKDGNVIEQADETKTQEDGAGRTPLQGITPSMGEIQGSGGQKKREGQECAEITVGITPKVLLSIQASTAEVSAKCGKSHESKKQCDMVTETSKMSAVRKSQARFCERSNEAERVSVWNTEKASKHSRRKTKRRRQGGELMQISGEEYEDVMLRRSKRMAVRKSIRKSLQSRQNLKRKSCWKRMTGQIIAELTRASLKGAAAPNCQVLESRCWNSGVQRVEPGLCGDMDGFASTRKCSPIKKVSKESSLTAASTYSVLVTDCSASVGCPPVRGRESVCSKPPKVPRIELVDGSMRPPGLEYGSECQAPRRSLGSNPKGRVRKPRRLVYRAPGLRRPRKGGLRLRMKQPD